MPTRTEPDALEGPCDPCGRRYVPWLADNEVWNMVMGGPDAGLLCPTCFCLRADVVLGSTTTIWTLAIRR